MEDAARVAVAEAGHGAELAAGGELAGSGLTAREAPIGGGGSEGQALRIGFDQLGQIL
jgi:hypothetical protein